MIKVIILTGNELRHKYFRIKVSSDSKINVIATFCEGTEHSLFERTYKNLNSSSIEKFHVTARDQSEKDFFQQNLDFTNDQSNPIFIKKGQINDQEIVSKIVKLKPDLLVCYGSSIIKSDLLKKFKRKFLNVHLGLSPYYRGSGTNVWPMINDEIHMVGATYMYIDQGIDTGEIIHQIRAKFFLGDSPHSIGNRLIKDMTDSYCKIIKRFKLLSKEIQPVAKGKLYLRKDFDKNACKILYQNFQNGMVENYLQSNLSMETLPYIVKNRIFNNNDDED